MVNEPTSFFHDSETIFCKSFGENYVVHFYDSGHVKNLMKLSLKLLRLDIFLTSYELMEV